MKLLKKRWVVRLIAFLMSWLLRWWFNTLHMRYAYEGEQVFPFLQPGDRRFIWTFWHESILGTMYVRPKSSLLISNHSDGELIARICLHLGLDAVRGSTSRDGGRAVLELRRVSEKRHLAITPDGPRGPRRKAQAGIVFVASITGLPVVPFGVAFKRAWYAKSWDRFGLPMPHSEVFLIVGKPIPIPPKVRRKAREEYRQQIEDELNRLYAKAEAWAQAGTENPPADEEVISLRHSA